MVFFDPPLGTSCYKLLFLFLYFPPLCKSISHKYLSCFRWWSIDTVAVVTGGNRGIGFEIARQLAAHGLTVVLTSRDNAVGEEATKVLQEGGFNVAFHQLDITVPSSISNFADWIRESYGGIDILVCITSHPLEISALPQHYAIYTFFFF